MFKFKKHFKFYFFYYNLGINYFIFKLLLIKLLNKINFFSK